MVAETVVAPSLVNKQSSGVVVEFYQLVVGEDMWTMNSTPLKTNIQPKNEVLQNDHPFKTVLFSGSKLVFRGVLWLFHWTLIEIYRDLEVTITHSNKLEMILLIWYKLWEFNNQSHAKNMKGSSLLPYTTPLFLMESNEILVVRACGAIDLKAHRSTLGILDPQKKGSSNFNG